MSRIPGANDQKSCLMKNTFAFKWWILPLEGDLQASRFGPHHIQLVFTFIACSSQVTLFIIISISEFYLNHRTFLSNASLAFGYFDGKVGNLDRGIWDFKPEVCYLGSILSKKHLGFYYIIAIIWDFMNFSSFRLHNKDSLTKLTMNETYFYL